MRDHLCHAAGANDENVLFHFVRVSPLVDHDELGLLRKTGVRFFASRARG
jgi:hypothetical protein